jgi:hypothetical protein
MGETGTVKKTLLIFLILTLNAIMVWFRIEMTSRWWYALFAVDVFCAGFMAYGIARIIYVSMKKKVAERAEHKVKKAHYRRMAM